MGFISAILGFGFDLKGQIIFSKTNGAIKISISNPNKRIKYYIICYIK
jgi:hypothetical protein